MSTTRVSEVVKARQLARAFTLREDFLEALRAMVGKLDSVSWPSPRWRDDPVGFARDVFGLELMPHQADMLRAIAKYPQVAVRSGNKAGKSLVVVLAALWFYDSFPDARVVMISSAAAQTDTVLWRQLVMLIRRAKLPIDGELAKLARSGLKAPDLREILGVSTDAAERLSGVSGGALLYIVDEASAPSFTEAMFQSLVGNTAGTGTTRIVMISNPTRAQGSPFYLAFTDRKDFWHCVHVNTEDVAAWCDARGVTIPGIANGARLRQWVEEFGGRDSPFYKVRVRGEFLLNEAGRAFPLDVITASQLRHSETPEEGVLSIGLDPAGPADGGDESAFALVRGWKHVSTFTYSGLTEDATIEHLLGFLRTYRQASHVPRVMVDAEGPIGFALHRRLRAISESVGPDKAFEVFGVRASGGAQREPQSYDRIRDELFANLRRWIDDGGAILADHKLERELHAIVWSQNVKGLLKATPKEEIREALHRSCDRLDALSLAVWKHGGQAPLELDAGPPEPADPRRGGVFDPHQADDARLFDPYSALDPWRGGR